MKTIFISGNPILSSDNLPLKILPHLKKNYPTIRFVLFDPTEQINCQKKQDLILIDTVFGINKVKVFSDLDVFAKSPRFGVHDYDLRLDLSILIKLKKLKKITIIGLPQFGKINNIIKQITKILSSMKL